MHTIKMVNVIGLILLLFSSLVVPGTATVYSASGTSILSDQLSVYLDDDSSLLTGNLPPKEVIFFTNSRCEACHEADEFLNKISGSHPEINIRIYDLFNNTANRTIFLSYKQLYHLDYLSTPSVMIGNLTLEGNRDIQNHLEEILTRQQEKIHSGGLEFILPSFSLSDKDEIPLSLIIGAGILDGINPCAFAVLIIMLINLMALKSRRAILVTGLIYTSAVFVFYFLSGLGIFSVIQTTGSAILFSIIAGSIALIAGLLMIKDALIPTDHPVLAIPESQAGRINKIINVATLPAAFLLGIMVGMFELPCTGGIYLSIISMISLHVDLFHSLVYLLVYNIAFIIPLLVILILVLFGLPPERVNEWRIEQRRALRGVIGIVLILFAVYILFGVLGRL
ncbi:cytochrome c biogenesis protein [Methanospirillum lacunae]|nr:cytochrome c biogenesis protein CcdA [Methanospirillum lacunae]